MLESSKVKVAYTVLLSGFLEEIFVAATFQTSRAAVFSPGLIIRIRSIFFFFLITCTDLGKALQNCTTINQSRNVDGMFAGFPSSQASSVDVQPISRPVSRIPRRACIHEFTTSILRIMN